MLSSNGHGPKRAILYARVSSDEQTPKRVTASTDNWTKSRIMPKSMAGKSLR
jgi:hypothetical protein